MGEAAVNVAKSCQYTGAGTVEFLLDANLNFYFLEMNTRLQVEHPVTEMITGLDLVEWQVRIARGEALTFTQEDLYINGHAIELRVYAEDPRNSFLPSINILNTYVEPVGEGVRIDSGFSQGMEIPIYYDPMISKLITHGQSRSHAISKMVEAIQDYRIEGIQTTLDFGNFVMHHEDFINGDFDTNFINKNWHDDYFDDNIKDAIASLMKLI
jgi:acetyl/propionyl-CoA carboxylase alpha subunit